MKKRLISMALASAIAATSLLGGCAPGNSVSGSNSALSSPQTSSKAAVQPASKTVRILTSVTGGKDDTEMKLFEKEISEKTGLTVEMDKPADYDTAMIQKLKSGEKYDLVYMTAPYLSYLAPQGVLKDITENVKKSSILSDPQNIDPQEWKDIAIDGKYYAGFNKHEVHLLVNLNNAQLKKAGIDYNKITPTLDGYYNLFETLKKANANVDGYYPFNSCISSVFDLQPWMAAVGLKGGIVTESGKNTVEWATDKSAPVWEWLAKLYKNGLLDPDSITDSTKQLRSKVSASKTSVVVDRVTQVGLRNNEALAASVPTSNFQIVSLPGIKTPDGSYMLKKDDPSLFAVPVNAPNTDGAIKILEFFATQEGGMLLSAGIKDHDYTVSSDGKYSLTDVGKKHGLDHGATFPIGLKFKTPFPHNPGVDEALSFSKYASIEQPTPLQTQYQKIMGKWAVTIVKGGISVKDGLAACRKELKENKIID